MTRFRLSATTLAVAVLCLPCVPTAPAEAAPTWCRAWRVNGQTWYINQSNGLNVLFTPRMAQPPSIRFSGYARFAKNPTLGGVPSLFIRGAVGSEGVGSIKMDVLWANNTRGQYNGTVYDVERRASGGLRASLRGVSVDTTGRPAPGATWSAYGQTNGVRPLWCPSTAVVR